MFAVSIYSFYNKSNSQEFLIYGAALEINDYPKSALSSTILCKKQHIKCYRGIMNYDEIRSLLNNAFVQRQLLICENKIETPKIEIRPQVYAFNRGSHTEFFKSITDKTSLGEIYFGLEKKEHLKKIFPTDKHTKEMLSKNLKDVEECIFEDIGLKLFSKDSQRFGNFEIYNSTDSLSLVDPIGINVDIVKSKKSPNSIRVWADETLNSKFPITINVTLINGRKDDEVVIFDQIEKLNEIGEYKEFKAKEPFSSYVVKAWSNDNSLLFQEHFYLIRSIQINMNINTGGYKITDMWSSKLPQKYKNNVENVNKLSTENIITEDYSMDPWVPESENFRNELMELFTLTKDKKSDSRFFNPTQKDEVKFYDYIRELICSSVVKKVIFVDPFFGKEAITHFLSRLNTTAGIEVITNILEKERDELTNSSLKSMKKFLNDYKMLLPTDLTIYNVQSIDAKEQQFHDRYFIIETDKGTQGWLLGNSFHSLAQKYPSIMVKIDNEIIKEVNQYINELKSGNIIGRKFAKVDKIYCSISEKCPVLDAGKLEKLPFELDPFPGWQSLLPLIIDNYTCESSALREVVKKGYLQVKDNNASWKVSENKKHEICVKIKDYLLKLLTDGNNKSKVIEFLNAISQWLYNGAGIRVSDILINSGSLVSILVEELQKYQKLKTSNMSSDYRFRELNSLKQIYDGLNDSYDSYNAFWNVYEYSYEYEGLMLEKRYLAEYLRLIDERSYYNELDKNWILLSHFLYILQRIDDFGTYKHSKVGTRLVFFKHFNLDKYKNLSFHEINSDEEVLKVAITQMSHMTVKDEELYFENLVSLIKEVSYTNESISEFILKLKFNTQVKLADILEETKTELSNELSKKILNNWICELKKEYIYFNFSKDYQETVAIAKITGKLFKSGEWFKWYRDYFISQFSWKNYRSPLLKFFKYSYWHSQSIRLLWTLYLGLNYLINEDIHEENCQDILNLVFDYFEEYLSPQIWQLSLDDILLDEVLYSLGYLSVKLDNNSLQRLITLTDSPKISPMRKLIVYLSSYESFSINKENALKILNSKTFLLQLEKNVVPRLKWIADVLRNFESEDFDKPTANIINAARKRILEILTSSGDSISLSISKLDLGDPEKVSFQWDNWANILNVNVCELEKIWKDYLDYPTMKQLISIGIYDFGGLQNFQQWLHSKDENRSSAWEWLKDNKQKEVLMELYRIFAGIPI